MPKLLTDEQRAFLNCQRVARLATANAAGQPHVIPICFALAGTSIYFTIDEKPKRRPGASLKRIRNIVENASIALVVDRYDEDWARLGWVMVRGFADVIESGDEHYCVHVTRSWYRCESRNSRWSPFALTT